jgi:hypothetical protein
MKIRTFINSLLLAGATLPLSLAAANNTIVGWNNLGMHCMDSDYSVFSILPPYNTIEAQLIVAGKLVTNGTGYTVTYQAVADPGGSINSTSLGKGNFYQYTPLIYGSVPVDMGLAGWGMPGANNTPQGMLFESTNHPAAGVATPVNWFRAEGIPIMPYDDAGHKNPYPLMRMIAHNAANQPIATNDVVLPVSDEMDCRLCHASGTRLAALPAAGWVWSSNPERDYRLNILRLHDERQFEATPELYKAALAARGFNPQGLYRGNVADGKPVLCASCHASEALAAPSYGTIPPLTASVHSRHAAVIDPISHVSLNDAGNRSACYRCHPGSTTRCLRGAMGGAIAADGSMEMQCQSCHGNMSDVGSTNRVGWFMEPTCQSCHTGTAVQNNGQIRYTSSFDAPGHPRVAVNQTFATQPNTPAAGLSLYRFSAGHGGLQCSACHGSTHAEFPSTHNSDNVRNIALQGHAGVMVECTACHTTSPNTVNGGPHGMHPVGQVWVGNHPDAAEGNRTQCQTCHGTDYRGTVLSRTQSNRTLTIFGGSTVTFVRGAIIGCYSCHNGPNSESANTSAAPTVNNITITAASGGSTSSTVAVTPSSATLRIISQPANGSVGVSNQTVTYFANPGFTGSDSFTYSAWDGSKNSSLGQAAVTVQQGNYSITAQTLIPATAPQGWPVSFGVVASPVNLTGTVTYDWDLGDGSAHLTGQFPTHAYGAAGVYTWKVISTMQASTVQASCTNSGTVTITAPESLQVARAQNQFVFSWPIYEGDALLEWSPSLGSTAAWVTDTNVPSVGPVLINVNVNQPGAMRFYRLRKL